jgi:hypothetical protein
METFDDFSRRHDDEQESRDRLIRDTKAEWEILKGLISRFAIDGQGFGGYKFETAEESGRRVLHLSSVAATLYDRSETNELPRHCTVVFCRRWRSVNSVFPHPSPLDDKVWSLEPELLYGEFVWFVPELKLRFSCGQLAEEVAKALAEYHLEYEKAVRL